MGVVLVTGMSGVGKSVALAELARRGHHVVDTGDAGWIEEVQLPEGPEPMWREDRIHALLDGHEEGELFVAGCVANQGKFHPRFDAIVLLSAPVEVILARVATRDNNHFGKTDAERQKIVSDRAWVEALLRTGATLEIDTRVPLHEVADALEEVARSPDRDGSRR